MKKLLILFSFLILGLTSYSQTANLNDWVMNSNTINLVKTQAGSQGTTYLINNYVQGCCTNCVLTPPPGQTFGVLFTKISGTGANPQITVSTSLNSQTVVWNGNVGTISNLLNLPAATYSTAGCPSGNVTGKSGNIVITLTSTTPDAASYKVSLSGFSYFQCWFGEGDSSVPYATVNIN